MSKQVCSESVEQFEVNEEYWSPDKSFQVPMFYICDEKIKTRNSDGEVEILISCGKFISLFSKPLRDIVERTRKTSKFIELFEFETNTIKALLTFIHFHKVENFDILAHDLLRAAEEYEYDGLKVVCLQKIMDNLDATNVIESLVSVNNSSGFDYNRVLIFSKCLNIIIR